jgi:chemotaxis protein MotB
VIRQFSLLLFLVSFVLLLPACGHSEDEWKAQLAKYGQLDGQYKKEKSERAKVQGELDRTKKRVSELTEQLQEMGLNLDTISQQLKQTGSEKEELSSRLEQLKKALEEYKQRSAQLEAIKGRFDLLRQKLQKLTNLGLKVEIRRNRMVIRLPGDVLFASGKDELKEAGKKVLDAVADVIRTDAQLSKRYFQVAGHTDNKPLRGGPFGDNWGLSVMRARQTLLYLVAPTNTKGGGGGLDPNRMHAAGYGETDPIANNAEEPGRTQNRRVELVLMPDVEEMLDLKSLI